MDNISLTVRLSFIHSNFFCLLYSPNSDPSIIRTKGVRLRCVLPHSPLSLSVLVLSSSTSSTDRCH
jgi:hypothetical protein